MKDKEIKEPIDKNIFKAMSYEMAGEIGILDNEDMKNNKGLTTNQKIEKKKRENNS